MDACSCMGSEDNVQPLFLHLLANTFTAVLKKLKPHSVSVYVAMPIFALRGSYQMSIEHLKYYPSIMDKSLSVSTSLDIVIVDRVCSLCLNILIMKYMHL